MNSAISPETRRALAKQPTEQGLSRADADITVDLAAQACDLANEAFTRTVKLSPNAMVGLCVTHVAAQVLQYRMEAIAQGAVSLSKLFGISDGTVEVKL